MKAPLTYSLVVHLFIIGLIALAPKVFDTPIGDEPTVASVPAPIPRNPKLPEPEVGSLKSEINPDPVPARAEIPRPAKLRPAKKTKAPAPDEKVELGAAEGSIERAAVHLESENEAEIKKEVSASQQSTPPETTKVPERVSEAEN